MQLIIITTIYIYSKKKKNKHFSHIAATAVNKWKNKNYKVSFFKLNLEYKMKQGKG